MNVRPGRLRFVGLFLYGASIGLPDVALDMGPANVRLDDLFLLGLAAILVFGPGRTTSQMPLRPLVAASFGAYMIFCGISILGAALAGAAIDLYWVALYLGGSLVYLVLFSVLRSAHDVRALCCGLALGGILLAVQVYWRILAAGGLGLYVLVSDFYSIKHELAFSSWNPNTIGPASIITAFAALIAGHLAEGDSLLKRWPWVAIPPLVMLPALTLSRGASVALVGGVAALLLMQARWRPMRVSLVVAGLAGLAMVVLFVAADALSLAAKVNLASGQGTSRRLVFWPFAVERWLEHPLLGYGFGTEVDLYRWSFNRGSTHNSILSILLQTGMVGFVLLATAVSAVVVSYRRLLSSAPVNRFLLHAGIALMVATFATGMTSNTYPWQKMGVLALVLIASVPQASTQVATSPATRDGCRKRK